jgi:hypothetical protein
MQIGAAERVLGLFIPQVGPKALVHRWGDIERVIDRERVLARLDERKKAAFHTPDKGCTCFHCRRYYKLARRLRKQVFGGIPLERKVV